MRLTAAYVHRLNLRVQILRPGEVQADLTPHELSDVWWVYGGLSNYIQIVCRNFSGLSSAQQIRYHTRLCKVVSMLQLPSEVVVQWDRQRDYLQVNIPAREHSFATPWVARLTPELQHSVWKLLVCLHETWSNT
jgi:hypothetical protein